MYTLLTYLLTLFDWWGLQCNMLLVTDNVMLGCNVNGFDAHCYHMGTAMA